MKKQILATFCVIAGAFGLSAQNSVTLGVNMSGVTVDPNGVHIAGDFQSEIGASGDWQPGETQMTDDGNGLYSFTIPSLPNGTYQYKFINGNDWPQEESIPSESQVGGSNSNRFFVVDNGSIFLPYISFSGSSATDGVVNLTPIRFTVDLTGSTIDPAGVSCAGDWQVAAGGAFDWTPGQNKLYDIIGDDNVSLHTGIFYVLDNSTTFNYKFVNGAAFESVPSECAVSQNRVLTVAAPTTVKYCFSSCSDVCLPVMTYSLTLNVDMNFNCNFNVNGNDSVDVAGTFNGFSGGPSFLMSDLDNDGIYSITLQDVPAGEVKYKARIIRNANFGSGWEGGGDKVIQLSSDSVMAARCFGQDLLVSCNPIPAPSNITFRVDMSEATPAASIFIIGDFTTPPFQGGAIELTPVSLGIYETTVNNICPGKINYKFVNGDVSVSANEEAFPDTNDRGCVEPNGIGGFNRVYVRTSADPVTLAYKFSTCQEIVGIEEVVSPVSAIFPNPAQNQTKIQFSSETESYNVVVTDLLGKHVEQVNNVTGFHIVHRGNLPAGIYIVQVADSKGYTATKKLIFN